MNLLKGICALALLVIAIGCGGGGSSTPPPTPTPTPAVGLTVCGQTGTSCISQVVIPFGLSEQFQATATTGTTPPVNWSVNGVQGGSSATGTITAAGLYTAPTAFDSGKTVTITATAQSNSSETGSASALIVNNASAQTAPVLLGTTGGNATDSSTGGGFITCCSGTLGSLIQRGATQFILSNNHVLDKSGTATIGDAITQPGLIDNNCSTTGATIVANLSESATLKPSPCSGVCTGPAPSNVDAAIAAVVAGKVDPTGKILDLGSVNGPPVDPEAPSVNLATPATVLMNNVMVAKSGRSTGLTCSTLQVVNASVSVKYDSSCGGATAFTATFTNQVIVNGGSFSAAGDSGSLIVTADKAQPVALLFAGNSTSTTGNPIQDVINAFTNGSGIPMFLGSDHAVNCGGAGPAAPPASGSATLSPHERQRVVAVQQSRAEDLMRDPAIIGVDVGASEDSPREGALVVHVSGPTQAPVPPVIDGVRTKVIDAAQAGAARVPILSTQDMDQAAAVKENHAGALMSQPGIQGVGVGRSDDNPAETAVVIYVITGVEHPVIPAVFDGIRTKLVEGDRFRAFGWGKEKVPATKCGKK